MDWFLRVGAKHLGQNEGDRLKPTQGFASQALN